VLEKKKQNRKKKEEARNTAIIYLPQNYEHVLPRRDQSLQLH
jgi:hypothetical protein